MTKFDSHSSNNLWDKAVYTATHGYVYVIYFFSIDTYYMNS